MKHYDSIDRIQDNGFLLGKEIWAFNKLDGQNFCVKWTKSKGWDTMGSRKRMVDENDDQFGDAVRYFLKNYADKLPVEIKAHSGKGDVFCGIQEITFFFEWYGPNSFAGKHDFWDYTNGDMRLALIDVFLKKKGYMEPKEYYNLFKDSGIEIPELIYTGPLNSEIVEKIQNNDWTQPDAEFPTVKEGVVFKRSTLMKGQRRPSVKVKTKWWLEKLHSMYSEEECKKLE